MATTKIKCKRIDINFVKKNYPVLYDTIEDILEKHQDKNDPTSKHTREYLYGLCIEIALKSDGTVDLFEDDLPNDLLGDNFDDDNLF